MNYALTPTCEALEFEHESVAVIDRPPPMPLPSPAPSPAKRIKRRAPRRAKPVRLQDVARAADVSIATVSMVVNRNPRISPATAKHVQRFLNQMGYRPAGATAKMGAVRRGQPTLAVLLPAPADEYFGELISGISDAASRLGHALVIEPVTPEFIRNRRHVNLLEQKEVDGMICLGFNDHHVFLDDFAADPRASVVVVDSPFSRGHFDSVGCDYRSGAQQAMNYLLQLGHRRIGLITAAAEGRSMRDIPDVYRNALTDHGVTPVDGWIVDGRFTEAGGDEAAERLLLEHPDITGILAASDRMAIGALHAAQRRGVKVPDELSIIGFGNLPHAAFLNPPLTTVQVPLHAVGMAACERLIERVTAGRTEAVCEQLATHLMIRGSSAPARDLPASFKESFAA